MFIIGGNQPQAEFTDEAMDELLERGLIEAADEPE